MTSWQEIAAHRKRRNAMLIRHGERRRKVLYGDMRMVHGFKVWSKVRDWFYAGDDWIRQRDKEIFNNKKEG